MNYKELSNNELIEIIKNNVFDPELIKECISRNSISISHLLNKLAKENPEIQETYQSVIDLPTEGEITFFPNKDSIELKNLPEGIIIDIPEHKKRIYQRIAEDSDFSLNLKVKKIENSLLEYRLIEKKSNKFLNFINNSFVGNASMATVALSAAVLVFQGVHLKNKISSHSQNISIVEDVSFIDNYQSAIKELGLLGYNTSKLTQLTNKDISLILSLGDDISDLEFEIKKDEVLESIRNVVKPYIKDEKKLNNIVEAIYESSQSRKVDYALFLSILKVETTTFNQNAVSSSGDISVAQIKSEVWKDEFARLGKEPLDVEKLKTDSTYAIDRMGEILEMHTKLKEKDPYWYARYHSKTPSRKLKYAIKVQKEYLKIKEKQLKEIEGKLESISGSLETILQDDGVRTFFINKDRIVNFKNEINKLKKIILENKQKGLKKMLARL